MTIIGKWVGGEDDHMIYEFFDNNKYCFSSKIDNSLKMRGNYTAIDGKLTFITNNRAVINGFEINENVLRIYPPDGGVPLAFTKERKVVSRAWNDIKRDLRTCEQQLSKYQDAYRQRKREIYSYGLPPSAENKLLLELETVNSEFTKETMDEIAKLEKELKSNDLSRFWKEKGLCPHCGGYPDSLEIKCKSCGKQLVSDEEAKKRKEKDKKEKEQKEQERKEQERKEQERKEQERKEKNKKIPILLLVTFFVFIIVWVNSHFFSGLIVGIIVYFLGIYLIGKIVKKNNCKD